MHNIKVIIGASYGDEGKGLATDFFGAREELREELINVLTNGGPQRGHTVELTDGRRHVFRHFGAASFRGAASYFAPQFLVNPMEFVREYDELARIHRPPEAYMHPGCRFTTPWDMLVNQRLREMRGLHNSCGFGIWETVLRYQRGSGIPVSAFAALSREDRIGYLRHLRDGYFMNRLRELGAGAPEFFCADDLLFHFEEDFETMYRLCPMRTEEYLKNCRTVLFENAQGLLLDGNLRGQEETTTPSTTGVAGVFVTIENVFQGAEVEICYVTRSYLTRHGDGIMENEMNAEEVQRFLPGVSADMTNRENRHQGALRYGLADAGRITDRIREDFTFCCGDTKNTYRPTVMVTHLNEYAGIDTDLMAGGFFRVYLSDGRTSADVCTRSGPGSRRGTHRPVP